MNGRQRTMGGPATVWLALLFGAGAAAACSKEPRKAPAVSAGSAPSAATLAPAPSAAQPSEKESAATGSAAGEPCKVVCSRSRELGCPNQQGCEKACAEMLSMPVCKDELVASLRCFGTHPASGWECGEDGLASIKDGLCNPEQARFVACFEAMAPR
jgi:hypothetical protein